MSDYPSQGTPMDVEDHPAYNKPDATEKYAGDVVNPPPNTMRGMGETAKSAPYASGAASDPKVLSIGMPTLKAWAARKTN